MQQENLFEEMDEDNIYESIRTIISAISQFESAEHEEYILNELRKDNKRYVSTFIVWLEVSEILINILSVPARSMDSFINGHFP